MPPETIQLLLESIPKEDELKLINDFLKKGSDPDILGEAEKFFAIIQMPFLKERLEAFLYKTTFENKRRDLEKKLKTIQVAIREIHSSKNLVKILEVNEKICKRSTEDFVTPKRCFGVTKSSVDLLQIE